MKNKKSIKKQLIGKISISFIVLSLTLSYFLPKQVFAKDFSLVELIGSMVEAKTQNQFPVSSDKEPVKIINVVATAYSSDVGQTDDTPCIPASGYNLCNHYEKYGEGDTIAANFLPLGTQVRIPELYGDKIFIVRDRMNARYGYGRIDVWMPERQEAIHFGVKRLKMEVF